MYRTKAFKLLQVGHACQRKPWDMLPVFTACHAIPCFIQEYLSETKLRYLKARTALSSSTLTASKGMTYWDEPIENWWLTSYITRQEDKPLWTGTGYLPSIKRIGRIYGPNNIHIIQVSTFSVWFQELMMITLKWNFSIIFRSDGRWRWPPKFLRSCFLSQFCLFEVRILCHGDSGVDVNC